VPPSTKPYTPGTRNPDSRPSAQATLVPVSLRGKMRGDATLGGRRVDETDFNIHWMTTCRRHTGTRAAECCRCNHSKREVIIRG
jgi:hypothetical protein